MKHTTPTRNNGTVGQFLRDARLHSFRLERLGYIFKDQEYLARNCLKNCELESLRSCCGVQYGWMIWEDPSRRLIEAEFHAVIRRDERLEDITPRVDGEEIILFVSDPNRVAVRTGGNSWRTWTNIISRNGQIVQFAQEISKSDL